MGLSVGFPGDLPTASVTASWTRLGTDLSVASQCGRHTHGRWISRARLTGNLPRMPMSYLPSFLSSSMRWSKVSEKYWNRAFCLCTSSPRMRFRNLVMEQSAGSRVSGRWPPLPVALHHHHLPRTLPTHPSPHPSSQCATPERRCPRTAGSASCLPGKTGRVLGAQGQACQALS